MLSISSINSQAFVAYDLYDHKESSSDCSFWLSVSTVLVVMPCEISSPPLQRKSQIILFIVQVSHPYIVMENIIVWIILKELFYTLHGRPSPSQSPLVFLVAVFLLVDD